MSGAKPKSVVLILARELASNIATPMLVIDDGGNIIYFNEPAEHVLGATFASVGEMTPAEYDGRWATTDLDGTELSLARGPMSTVVSEQTPGHRVIRIRGLDGVWHVIETTVYPLFASATSFVGAVGVFWELGGDYGPASRAAEFRSEG
jgi:PAS domain-containing protein